MSEGTGVPAAWERLSSYYFSTRKAINILVAPTADAAAASLSLTHLLKVFLYPFKLHPTSTYDELRHFITQANFSQDSERADASSPVVDDLFVLIGFGGAVVLGDYFDLARHIVIVVDAYRPFHLSNLRSEDGERLLIWGGDRIQAEVDAFFRAQRVAEVQRRRRRHRRRAGRPHTLLQRLQARELATSTSSVPEGGRGGHRRPHRRPRHESGSGGDHFDANGDAPSSIDDEEGDYEEEEESLLSSTSTDLDEEEEDDDDATSEEDEPNLLDGEDDGNEEDDMEYLLAQTQEDGDWRAADSKLAKYLEALYYSCAAAGRSSAVEMYDLAVLLQRFPDVLLWHAAIGVCDLYMRRLIDYGTYLLEMGPLMEATTVKQSMRRGALRDRTEEAVNQYRSSMTNSMQLRVRQEEQLYLLRHSTLWDAIWYEAQVASALDLHHTEEGRPRLSQLLASRCGVSMVVAQRPWREVPADVAADALRRVLAELQIAVAARGNALGYRSEIRCLARKVGYSTEVSTFDACRLFTAVLATVPPASVYVVNPPQDGTVLSSEVVTETTKRQLVEFQRQQFWRAHALLDMDPNEKPFHVTLADAFSLQQAVADATSSLMQPGNVQSSTGLHYAPPTDPAKTSPTLESFCTMQRLAVLSERLFFTLTQSRRRPRQALAALRPLILSAVLPQPRLASAGGTNTSNMAGPGTGDFSSSVVMSNGVRPTNNSGNSHSSGVVAGGGAPLEDTVTYVVVLTHAGVVGAGMAPLLPVCHFEECLHDDHFYTPPRRVYLDRNAVLVEGRENTTYLAERMLLLSVKSTLPRPELHRPRQEIEEEVRSEGDVEVIS